MTKNLQKTSSEHILTLAKILWQYHQMQHCLKPAEGIIVMGSQDTGAARRGVELYKQGYAAWLLFSGGRGKITKELWHKSEAEIFADIALAAEVPKESIMLETQSSNCGENILFSMQLLADKGVYPQRLILLNKPYLERRSFATFKQHFSHIELQVSSQRISFGDYLSSVDDVEQVIHLMVGDLQRIIIYPQKAWQIEQAVPDLVLAAFTELVELGFTQQLI